MKTAIKILVLLLLLTGQLAFGQKQEKIYYDNEWKVTTESKATFYRIVTFDNSGVPVGILKDYFVTGELQGESEAIKMDKSDDSKSKWKNKRVGYFKTGKKQFENNYDEYGNKNGSWTNWYENGNKKLEATYKNDKPDGEYVTYYENGKLKYKLVYYEGKLVDKWFTECDEFEKCQKVFFDGFKTTDNDNNWRLVDKGNYKSEIIAGEGLMMKTQSDNGFAQWINLPIDIYKNFSIETIINFKSD